MSKYHEVAQIAAENARDGVDPAAAWDSAAQQVFPNHYHSREKSCPRCAFLGLAEDGMIVGVPRGTYTRSKHNKCYAIKAL